MFKRFLISKQTQNGSIWARVEKEETGFHLVFLYAGKQPIAAVYTKPNHRIITVPELEFSEDCPNCKLSPLARKIEKEILSYLPSMN